MSRPIRVRFAPSPTGYLHVGGARTALYNYLFAKSKKGKLILRIEDTDLQRSREESLRGQLKDLQWLGLHWDEGIDPETLKSFGEFGPYRQSERLDIYKKYGQQLLEKGFAYYDFRSDEQIEELKQKTGNLHFFPRPDPPVDLDQVQKRIHRGEKAAIRFKVHGSRDHIIHDLVRGQVRLSEDMLTDFVLIRSNGMPVYNFCCAVDDALMEISHVFRAEEHLNNSLRQKMIHEALGFSLPQWVHLSLVLGKDRQKLSKRHGTTSCHQYRQMGYLPEALLNFVALLGWSPGNNKEVMDMDELIRSFDLSGLIPSGAMFDGEKFRWMNSVHLRKIPNTRLWKMLQTILEKENICLPDEKGFVDKMLDLFKSKMEVLNDAVELLRPIDENFFKISEEAQPVLDWEMSPKILKAWRGWVKKMDSKYMTADEFSEIQDKIRLEVEVKGRHLFMPIRVAVIGKPQGSDLKSLVPLIEKNSLLNRVEKAMMSHQSF